MFTKLTLSYVRMLDGSFLFVNRLKVYSANRQFPAYLPSNIGRRSSVPANMSETNVLFDPYTRDWQRMSILPITDSSKYGLHQNSPTATDTFRKLALI